MALTQPDGYLALPTSGKGNGVLVLHAWWGLNDTIKAFCDRLAEAGFITFAPDLYHGKVTNQISEAEKLGGALDQRFEEARVEVANALGFLKEKSDSSDAGIAVIGFSLGGYYALDLAVRSADAIRSVVLFYASGPADLVSPNAEYLGHFAENDAYEPQEYIDGLEEGLKAAGRPVTFYTYPNAQHWFFEPDRTDVYDAEASTLAWERTLAFLRRSIDA